MKAVRRVALTALCCLFGLVVRLPAMADPPYAGRPLIEVLREFQEGGVDLVFSSAVVRPDWIVEIEPSAGTPVETLAALLAPFELALRDGPAGALLVVPAPRSSFVTEIVVTPGRHTVARQEHGSRFRLTHETAITAPSASVDAGRVVQLLPGVTAPENSAAFQIRGSVARDASLILDGLELYDPYHLQAFQSPYSLIDGNSVDTIDLRSGGYTADLGDRHGGFVEISTLVPDEFGGEIEVGTLNSRATFRSPTASGRGALLVSARTWYTDAVFDHTDLGAGERSQPSYQDLYAKTSFAVSPRWVLSAHLLLGYDRLAFEEPGDEMVDAETRNANLWSRVLTAWTPAIRTATTVSVGRIDKVRDGISNLPGDLLQVSDDREVDFFGVRSVTHWGLGERDLLKFGTEYRGLHAAYRYSTQELGDPASLTRVSLRPRGSSFGVFAAHRRSFGSKWTTETGVRWDVQSYTDDNHLSPRFNAVWRPGPRSELRLAIGRFKQSQRIHELDVQDGGTAFSPAETSEQVELSYERVLASGVRLRVDAYHRSLSQLRPRFENLYEPIELFPETAPDRVSIVPDRARLRGLELLLRSPAGNRLFWWSGYTLARAEDREGGRWIPRAWDQTHAIKFLLGYRSGERWSVALSGTMRSGWPTTPVAGEIVILPGGMLDTSLIVGPRNSDRLPGYRRFDVKARRSFESSRGKLWLTLEVANLLDTKNLCCVDEFIFENGPPGPTRVARVFDPWIGIRPSFNLLWEF